MSTYGLISVPNRISVSGRDSVGAPFPVIHTKDWAELVSFVHSADKFMIHFIDIYGEDRSLDMDDVTKITIVGEGNE